MIEPNTTWYLGEMFTSQITRGTKGIFWTLTPYDSSKIYGISYDWHSFAEPTRDYYARPSMYLNPT